MQWATAFHVNHSLDGPGRKMQNVTFSKFHQKNQDYFSITSKDQKYDMCLRNTFPTFQYSSETRLQLIW